MGSSARIDLAAGDSREAVSQSENCREGCSFQIPSCRPSLATQATSELVARLHSCCVTLPPLLGPPVSSTAAESSLLYRIPLLDGVDGVRTLRAITITLAWFSPVNSRDQGYRMAALDVAYGSDQKFWIAPQRSLSPQIGQLLVGLCFTKSELAKQRPSLLTRAICCCA
jgi:hypothetical protein